MLYLRCKCARTQIVVQLRQAAVALYRPPSVVMMVKLFPNDWGAIDGAYEECSQH